MQSICRLTLSSAPFIDVFMASPLELPLYSPVRTILPSSDIVMIKSSILFIINSLASVLPSQVMYSGFTPSRRMPRIPPMPLNMTFPVCSSGTNISSSATRVGSLCLSTTADCKVNRFSNSYTKSSIES